MTGGATDRLAAAKLWLISSSAIDGTVAARGLPYLAHALYSLVTVISPDVDRVTADEHWRVYANPHWLEQAPIPEIGAELAHLSWHLLLAHADRARDMRVDRTYAAVWRKAADCTIGQTLTGDGLDAPGLDRVGTAHLPPAGSTEQYYAQLSGLPVTDRPDGAGPDGHGETGDDGSAEPDASCGSGADGIARGYERADLGKGDSVDLMQAEQIRRRVAIDYTEHVTTMGTEKGNAWRWARQILEPRIAWEPLLSAAVRRAVGWTHGHAEYTYQVRSRRQSSVAGIVLPGTRRPLPAVAMIIDTSGSVDDSLLGRALGEVEGALRAIGVAGPGVTVLACDSAVQTVNRVRHVRDARLGGGGGTDMREGIAAAVALRPRPDVIVVFTDGYTPWPSVGPSSTPVVAAILGRDSGALPASPDWATRIECVL